MKPALVFLCALLIASSASAQGVYNMAKQQAKNAANNGSGQQGGMQPQPSLPQNNQPPDPALQATLRNISNLRVDFEGFDSNPTNTVSLQGDLTAAAQGTKASPASVVSLAGDLAAAISGNAKLHAQRQKLAQYVHAMFNGSHLSPAQQQMILNAVQKILSDAGVVAEAAASVISDLNTIANETK
jgi:hypothetical protein